MNGGKCVIVLKTGTNSKALNPIKNTAVRSKAVLFVLSSLSSGASTVPFIKNEMIINGINKQIKLGRMSCVIKFTEVI